MNEHVTNETPTEIAGDAGVLAEMAALRHRLAALEARLPGNAPEQQAKRRTSTKTVAWLTTGAVLAMLAGASLVYGQSAVGALFISKEGNVGIGTSTPLATAKLQVAGAGGGWFSPDATSGAGVRVWQDGATGSVFSYDYKAGGPRNLVLQQPGGNVGIGTATPQADNKLEVNGKIAATSLNVDSATMKSLTALGALTVEKDTTVKGPMKIEGNNVLEFGAGVEGKEVSAGKIGYQVFATKDALDIVGAGTADGKQPRKIKFWAEGGATFAGSLNVSGAVDGNMKVVYQRDDEAQTTYEKPLWRYHMSLMAAKYAGGSKTIPKDILTKLCGTRDGCEVRLGMTRWG
jgi:hypothetical protein